VQKAEILSAYVTHVLQKNSQEIHEDGVETYRNASELYSEYLTKSVRLLLVNEKRCCSVKFRKICKAQCLIKYRNNQWRTQEFCSGRGVEQIQLRTEDRENGDLEAVAPLVRGSGGSCNLVQEILFHIVKFS